MGQKFLVKITEHGLFGPQRSALQELARRCRLVSVDSDDGGGVAHCPVQDRGRLRRGREASEVVLLGLASEGARQSADRRPKPLYLAAHERRCRRRCRQLRQGSRFADGAISFAVKGVD